MSHGVSQDLDFPRIGVIEFLRESFAKERSDPSMATIAR